MGPVPKSLAFDHESRDRQVPADEPQRRVRLTQVDDASGEALSVVSTSGETLRMCMVLEAISAKAGPDTAPPKCEP